MAAWMQQRARSAYPAGAWRRIFVVALVTTLGMLIGAGAASAATKALINDATIAGGASSQEAMIATAYGYDVTIVSDATWGSMTQAEFGEYDVLIAGDGRTTLPPGLISSASVYGPVVMGNAGGRTAAGNRVVVGTDPVGHDGGDYTSPNARGTIIREGIGFAATQPGTTGMYFTAGYAGPYGQSAEAVAILDALSEGLGEWSLNANPPCGGSVSLIAANPSFSDLTTASLQGWGCSVHETFPTFRSDWSALAVATDTPSKPTCGVDPNTAAVACGEAYILIAGSGIVVASGSISVTPLDSTSSAGGDHTVTANVTSGDDPLPGQTVDFTVTGQNAGVTGSCGLGGCVTDAAGDVSFTYRDDNGAGDDTIKASFTDARGSLQAATAQKTWLAAAAPVLTTTSSDLPYAENDPATAVDPGLTASDSDSPNLAGASVRVSSGFEAGDQLAFTDASGITGTYNSGTGVLTLTGTATVADYQAALRSVTYRHVGENPSATKTVEFKANDGGLDSNTPTRDIAVAVDDDAPTAVDDSGTVAEDAPATAVDVLANDTDTDGGSKSVDSATQPAHGVVAITGGGTAVTYQPDADWCGTDTFTYTLGGGSTATVSMTVTCVDDAPTAVNDSKTVKQDSAASDIDVLANDTDSDGGTRTISAITQPSNGTAVRVDGGKRVSYRPDTGYCNSRGGAGPDTFTYTLNGDSQASVAVKVECVEARAPEGEPEPAPEAEQEPTPSAGVRVISHRNVVTNSRGALIKLRCVGTDGARCVGSVQLRSTRLSSRLQAAGMRGRRTKLGFAAGTRTAVRVAVPAASRRRLATKGKAVARAILRLQDGTVVTRLVSLYPAR